MFLELGTTNMHHKRNVNISEMKKDISKRETPFFCNSKCLSNKQKKFYVIYTLMKTSPYVLSQLLLWLTPSEMSLKFGVHNYYSERLVCKSRVLWKWHNFWLRSLMYCYAQNFQIIHCYKRRTRKINIFNVIVKEHLSTMS